MSNQNKEASRKLTRRGFSGAALAATGTAIATPAIAQGLPKVKWRLASSFGRNIPLQFNPVQSFIQHVKDATDGQFEIQWFGPGDLVGAFQVFDAVGAATVEMGQTLSNYYIGKDPTFAFGTGIPFGMDARGHGAWLANGGQDMLNDFYKPMKVHALPAGNSGAHMAGWFRSEIKSAADLKGLKLRVAGMAGQVLRKAGGVPQQIAPSDVYPALERGVIDACKLATPGDDEKFGLHKIAPYYYYPGWNDPGAATHIVINLDLWNGLPPAYRAVLKSAAALMGQEMQTAYDSEAPQALRRLVAQGAQLRPFPQDVIAELETAARAVYAELSAQNPTFKKFHDHYTAFATNHFLWWQAGEYAVDTLGIRYYRKA